MNGKHFSLDDRIRILDGGAEEPLYPRYCQICIQCAIHCFKGIKEAPHSKRANRMGRQDAGMREN